MATASDNFNRANGPLGANWTDLNGTSQIVSNQATGQPSVFCLSRYSAVAWADNHRAQCDVVDNSDHWGLAVRIQDANNYITATGRFGTYDIYEVVGGVATPLTSTPAQGTSPLTLEVNGTTVATRWNGVLHQTVTTSLTGAGSPGIRNREGIIDNWSAEDVVSATPAKLTFTHA